MATRYMFFDAVDGDRSYDYAALAALLRALTQQDGVVYNYGSSLAVSATDPASMNVTVATGAAFVQGRMFEVHTAAELKAIGAADPTYPRIDRVTVKLDNSSGVRSVTLAVKAGTPAASPSPPTLQRDGTVWELSLAQVYVAAGATSITSANITDERSDETVCGYVPRTPDIIHRGSKDDATGLANIIDTLASVRIVGMGSNANGSYVRFANGLQICWGAPNVTCDITTSDTGMYRSSGTAIQWTFPASFSAAPIVSGIPLSPVAVQSLTVVNAGVTATGVSFLAWRMTSATGASLTVHSIAIGLWG